jgi:hypothetical protein
MTKKPHKLVTHTFKGGRFEDHGLDFDVLPDLVAYKSLLVETAKELWKRKNPDRQRLPNKFDDSLVLKFYEIVSGSVAIPICREIEESEQSTLLPDDNELDEAVELVTQVIDAADREMPLPDDFPVALLEKFENYGKCLREDEFIEHRLPNRRNASRYTPTVRNRLSEYAARPYHDDVDVVGTVTMARVTKPRMSITLENAVEVEAPFPPEQEDIITTALKEHSTAKIRLQGRGQFLNGSLHKIVEVESVELLPGGEIPFDETSQPIWEVFEKIMLGVPEEELDKLPVDGAAQHDHYIYGVPKR